MSKVLFLTNLGSDYGEYFNLHGFSHLLPGRVWEWPRKNTYHNAADHYPERVVGNTHYLGPQGAWSELWTDPSLYRAWEPSRHPGVPVSGDGPLHFATSLDTYNPTFEEIIVGITSGEIKLVVLGSARWHSSAALSEILSIVGRDNMPALVLTDMEDYYQMRTDYIGAFYPDIYFKRTFIRNGNPCTCTTGITTPIYALPFSSMWDFPFTPWEEREIDVFCVFGNTQILRKRVKDTVCKAVQQVAPKARIMAEVGHPMGHAEYLKTLQNSKLVIDHQRLGTDCVRTWEALASGCCLVGDLHLEFENGLVPGAHFYQYENDMSWQGDQQKMHKLAECVMRAVLNPESSARMARESYDIVRAKHTTTARARYILEKVKQHGFDLGDLL